MGSGLSAIYDVYGLREPALGNEPTRLAEALGVAWEDHDSDYRGTYYIASWPSGGRLVLQANDLRDSSGGYLQLPDFPQYRFLLFVNECPRPEEIRSRLASLPHWRFLNRRVLD